MFDIAWSELLVVAVVAIIIVGPKELPRLMRTFGYYMGKVRRMSTEFQRQFEEAVRESELEEVGKALHDLRDEAPVVDFRGPIDKPLMTPSTPKQEGWAPPGTPTEKTALPPPSPKPSSPKPKTPSPKPRAKRESTQAKDATSKPRAKRGSTKAKDATSKPRAKRGSTKAKGAASEPPQAHKPAAPKPSQARKAKERKP